MQFHNADMLEDAFEALNDVCPYWSVIWICSAGFSWQQSRECFFEEE